MLLKWGGFGISGPKGITNVSVHFGFKLPGSSQKFPLGLKWRLFGHTSLDCLPSLQKKYFLQPDSSLTNPSFPTSHPADESPDAPLNGLKIYNPYILNR